MSLKPILFPYKLGSASAKALASALESKRVRPDGRYRPFLSHAIVNWGNSQNPRWVDPARTGLWLNKPEAVTLASNKWQTFVALSQEGVAVPTPEWTTQKEVAQQWDKKVVVRAILNGSGGAGITVVEPGQPLPDAPLYTKYLGKRSEWRVHVFGDSVISAQYKALKNGTENPNFLVRNHANNWVYTRGVVGELSEDVKAVAVKAVKALGLDFGAVDLALREDQAYVLEINTAPGLQGQTVTAYVEAIRHACIR